MELMKPISLVSLSVRQSVPPFSTVYVSSLSLHFILSNSFMLYGTFKPFRFYFIYNLEEIAIDIQTLSF